MRLELELKLEIEIVGPTYILLLYTSTRKMLTMTPTKPLISVSFLPTNSPIFFLFPFYLFFSFSIFKHHSSNFNSFLDSSLPLITFSHLFIPIYVLPNYFIYVKKPLFAEKSRTQLYSYIFFCFFPKKL